MAETYHISSFLPLASSLSQGYKGAPKGKSHAPKTCSSSRHHRFISHSDEQTSKDMTRDDYRDIELAQLHRLEFASLVEGTTLLFLLVIAVPLKHLYGWPIGVRIMGPVHGLAFCAYLWFVVQTVTGGDWRTREIARVLICAFIPFGAFFNHALLSRKITSIRNGKKS